MQVKRIFIGFDISTEARTAATGHINELRRDFRDCRASWTPPEKLHFTLRFLGNVEAGRIGGICGAVEDAAARCSKFDLRIAGAGVFPSTYKPRVLWLGADGDLSAVSTVKARLDDKLSPHGFEPEHKRFTPHLTLARLKDPVACRPLVRRHFESTIRTSLFTVAEIVLYESQLLPSGSIYSIIMRAELPGGENITI